jgi:protein ImuB
MFASAFIPNFAVQALVRSDPELAVKPLAVVDGTPPLLKVAAASASALSAGIEVGMAKLKVEHFFDAVIRQRSEPLETSARAALLDCAHAFSPRVEDTAADTVVIDLDGLERLFGSYHEIAAQIYDRIILVGLHANIAVAANPDAAVHASRGFEGILVIPAGSERQRLSTLPLEILSPDPDFIETLHRWGIWSFGAFAKLPAKQISERLGQDGVRLHKLARGVIQRPLNPYQESLRFEEALELEHSIALLEPLTFVLSRLLDQVCKRLQIRSRATTEIRVTLDLDEHDAAAHQRILRLPLPVCDAKLLLKLLMLDLESHPPSAAVTKVHLEAIPTRPRTVQNGLFAPLAPEPEKLELTLARIAHIVGKENVGSPELVNTHRPDSFNVQRFDSLAAERRKNVAPGVSPGLADRKVVQPRRGVRFKNDSVAPPGLYLEQTNSPGLRPGLHSFGPPGLGFRQFRPALDATVQLRNGVPSWIAFHGTLGPVTTASGPWKSSGDWWRDDHWNREEWDVGIDSPTKGLGLYRVYRDLASNRWYAEGVYD